VEVELLFAGYGMAVSGGGVEGPLLNDCNNSLVDAVTEAAGHLDIGDLTGGVNNDIEDDVSFCATGKSREVGLWRWKVAGECDVDVAFTERVCSGCGVGVGGSWRVGVRRVCIGFQLWRGWRWERSAGSGLRGGFRVGCGRLDRSAAGKVGDHEIGAVLVAGEANRGDEGGALVDDSCEKKQVQEDGRDGVTRAARVWGDGFADAVDGQFLLPVV